MGLCGSTGSELVGTTIQDSLPGEQTDALRVAVARGLKTVFENGHKPRPLPATG
jgi:hypothetical protein